MKTSYNYIKKENLDTIKNYTFKNEVENWYKKVTTDPTAKNSAIFYGQGGTGKTALAHLVAKETNKPLFVCYGNSALTANFNDKLEGITAKDKFQQLITDIETGIYDNGVEKIKTEVDKKGYVLLIEWAEKTSEDNFLREASKDLLNNPDKPVLYIFLTDIRSHKEIEEIPYLYKNNLQEVFFSFQLPFLKTLLEKEGINVPNSFPNTWYNQETIDLIWNFTFFNIKDFAKFWQENDISDKLSGNAGEIEKELTKWLEKFWSQKDKHWFINEYKITEERKQKKIIESLEEKIVQNRGDLLMLYYEVGFLRKKLAERK